MFNLQRHLHGLSRLIVGLFAVQFFVGAFCLITPMAEASSLSLASELSINCDKEHSLERGDTDHGMGCSHCDLHDVFISSNASTFNIDLPLILLTAHNLDASVPQRVGLSVHPATAPPLNFPLLHHTNQRILI
ncbi:MAG: hypothetical protein Q9M22_06505 [Mariprofundaceae bacterium]|nr:hypothetical protein [Mariprofundaceae bacterium]